MKIKKMTCKNGKKLYLRGLNNDYLYAFFIEYKLFLLGFIIYIRYLILLWMYIILFFKILNNNNILNNSVKMN